MNRRKVGLVLGAGAARGFAHIGVLQVLEEEKIPVDIVTGCSMGALVGALYVTGMDLYFMEKYARSFEILKYIDLTLRRGGFLRGARIERLIGVLTKHKTVEEADRPYACVAVDLSTGEIRTFTKGPIYQAVRASISMPGFFTPYEKEGQVYIDGGVLDRLPIDAARELGAQAIIGVDVAYRGERQPRPSNVVETLRYTLNISEWHISKDKIRRADVLLLPDVYKTDPFSTKDAAFAVEQGRISALENLDRIKAAIGLQPPVSP